MNTTQAEANKGYVLVVDDTPENLQLLSDILQKYGYRVRIAINGQTALNAAQEDPPDLILLDIMMPELNGYEVCQRLKVDDRTREIPVIFLSALNQLVEKVKAFDIGGVDYITKPFQVQEVMVRIENQLQVRSLQKQLQEQNARLQQEIHRSDRAEAALRLSEEKFSKAFRCSPSPITISTLKDGRFIEVNTSFCKISGYSKEEVIDRTALDLNIWVNSEERTKMKNILAAEGTISELEFNFRIKSGEIRTGLLSAEIIEISGQKCLLSVIHDITDRKRLEENILQQERFLQSIIEHIPLAIFAKDVTHEFRFVLWNKTCEQMFGTPREEAIGRHAHDLYSQSQADFFLRQDLEALQSGKLLEIPEVAIDSDSRGTILLKTLKVPLFDDRGQPTHLLCISEDITQRKQAESELKVAKERFELAIAAANDGFWDWDLLSEKIYLSPRWKQMLGYEDCELPNELASWETVIFEEDRIAAFQLAEDYNSGKVHRFQSTQRYQHKNGSTVYVLCRAIHIKDTHGQAIRMVGTNTDITELVNAQEALGQSEAQMRALLNAIPDRMFWYRKDGTFLDFKEKGNELIEYNNIKIGGNLEEINIFPALKIQWLDLFKEAINTGIVQIYEHEFQSDERVYNYEARIVKSSDDEVVCIVRDITESKQAELALKQQKEILQTIFDRIPVMVVFVDPTDEIQLVNQEFEKLLGWSVEEVKHCDLLAELYPDPNDRQNVWEFIVAATGKWQDFKARNRAGELLDTSWANIRLSNHALLSIGQDVTERKRAEEALRESEERFRVLVTSAPVGILQMDDRGECVFVNPRWIEITGLSLEAAIGQGWISGLHPDDRDLVLTRWSEATSTGKEFAMEYRLETPWKELRWVSGIIVAIRDRTGAISGYLGTITDISDRKQAEEELRQQEAAIRALYKVASAPHLNFDQRLQGLLAMGRRRFDLEIGLLARMDGDKYDAIATQMPPRFPFQIHPGDVVNLTCTTEKSVDAAKFNSLDAETEWELSTYSLPPHLQVKTCMNARVVVQGQTYGILCFFSINRRSQPFKSSDRQLLKLMAQWVGHQMERQHSKTAIERQMQRALLLGQITREIRSSLDSKQIFQTAATQIGQAFKVNRCLIHAYISEPTPQVPLVAEYLEPGYKSILDLQVPIAANSHMEEVLASDRAIATHDVRSDPLLQQAQPLCFHIRLASMLVVRTSYKDQPNGVICLHQCDRKRQWSLDEIELIEAVAAQVGIALAQANLLEREKQRLEELTEKNSALEQARHEAEAANRAKSRFLSHMSHELRTPLNAILGFTQLLSRDSSLSPSHREPLEIISRSGEHLLSLIDDVLEMSKIEAGKVTLHENTFDLYRLLDTLEQMLALKASSKGLELRFDRAPNVPQSVKTDEKKLRQVLINLLGNAIKFTESGRVTLRVGIANDRALMADDRETAIAVSPQRLSITFEIEDTGPGIAPEELDSLFEIFVQTETGRNSQQGTGLGLPISREFVRLMGGNIAVESTVGRGTKFTFDINVECLDDATETASNAIADRSSHVRAVETETLQPTRRAIAIEPNQPQYRISIVDDIPESRQLLATLLSSVGFEVRCAVNGREAVALWESWKPHLIWMDMRMPVMDGYEATRQIKAKAQQSDRNTIIIALTASAFEEKRSLVLAAGCDDFVRKPFREETLFEKMAQHLGVRYLYQEPTPIAPTTQTNTPPSSTIPTLKASIEKMPSEWVTQLNQAAVCADAELIFSAIAQIPESNSALAKVLTDWVNDFRFDKIIEITFPHPSNL